MHQNILYVIIYLASVRRTADSFYVETISNPTYSLIQFSRIHLRRIVTGDSPLIGDDEVCVSDGNKFRCSSKELSRDLYYLKQIRTDNKWDLVFEGDTKAYDIEVNFHRAYLVQTFLLTFISTKDISAGSIKITDVHGFIHVTNFASSKLICKIIFSELEDCLTRDLASAWKYIFTKPVVSTKVVIRLYPPVVNSYNPKPYYTINHFKLYGECYCSSGRNSQCITASEGDLQSNAIQRRVLLCASDIWQLPFTFYVHKRRRRRNACACNRGGTLYGICSPIVGLGNQCPCKHSFRGLTCDACSDGFFNYPRCTACRCNYIGSKKAECDLVTGKCLCEAKYTGDKCDQCAPGRYHFPYCYPCPCSVKHTKESICDPVSGTCHCQDRYRGKRCTACSKWLLNYPTCHRPGCECSGIGSLNGTCNDQRMCFCRSKFAGKRCDQCKPGFGDFPVCTTCDCDSTGSYSNICDPKTGQCHCKPSFGGRKCDQCKQPGLVYPDCNDVSQSCDCHVAGTKTDLKRNGACVDKVSCKCKYNVQGADCSKCKPKHYNLTSSNVHGCTACQCHSSGSFANLASCDLNSGQCSCKQAVTGRRCDRCQDGYRSLNMWNLFGCLACNCDIGGSLGVNCDHNGYCSCKENFKGKTCNILKSGNTYVPDYYHNMYEMESALASNGKPVTYYFNSIEFVNFTGVGYISFGDEQSSVKLLVDVPKTRKYILIIHYLLRRQQKASVLLYFTSQDRSLSYATSVDFQRSIRGQPAYSIVNLSANKKETVLFKGTWELELSARSSDLLVDNVVLIPEEYFTAKKLQPEAADACLVEQAKGSVCVNYKYIDLQKFQLVQGESGTDSKGYGSEIVKKTRVFNDKDILEQLPVLNSMAELSKNQIALSLHVSVQHKDSYNLIVTYYNPDDRTYRLDLYDGESRSRGYLEAVPCRYRFLCRAVVLQGSGNPFTVHYDVNRTSEITFLGNIFGTLAVDHVALIPSRDWSPDYIIPRQLCYSKDNVCLQNIEFQTPDDSILVRPTDANPVNPLTKAVYATSEKSVYFKARLAKKSKYTLVYQQYQPNHPAFRVKVNIFQQDILKSSADLKIRYCPSNSGCRDRYINGELEGNVTVEFEVPDGKEMWIASMYLIPKASYKEDILLPKRTELTQKFKRSCIEMNGLPMRSPPDGFCMQALVTLTSEFTNKIFKCACNKDGALATQCAKIGGHCSCKMGVVGKNCDGCQTGYYGFPRCRVCNCYTSGSVNADCNRFGQCKCKPNFTGRKCNQCKRGHWGFPKCHSCDCDRRGSFSIECRDVDGQCSCLRNYAGRQCGKCQVGNYDFPYCRSCNCHSAGILVSNEAPTGCYSDNPNRCECKRNVEGHNCGRCRDHYYNLTLINPLGCSACNCSEFGTIRGAGPCHKESGKCICKPNVVGRTCEKCKDGYFVVESDKVFSCQPCLCSAGGSVDDVCDKYTGQCKCKPRVGGLKCDRTADGGYYLPSVGQYVFTAHDIVPYARRVKRGTFDGVSVNGSFASVRLNMEITQPTQTFYIMIYYALENQLRPRIDLEFSKKYQIIAIKENLKAKSLVNPTLDILKRNGTFFRVTLTKGIWNLQVLFHETILLNQITLVPTEHFGKRKVTRSIHNPCTIFDTKRYCSMYTYYHMHSAVTLEGEQFTDKDEELFDLDTYKGANINGALMLSNEKVIEFNKKVDMSDFYVVFQYVNIDSESVMVEVTIATTHRSQTGVVELFPCLYAFACRQVVLTRDRAKVLFSGGNIERKISLKVLTANSDGYLDYLAFIPRSSWSANLISPSFYCSRRLSRCIDGVFPIPNNSMNLDASKASRVLASVPPDSHPETQAVLMTSRRQRNLRWISPLRSGGYYIVIHYYQPLMDTFVAKVIVMTYQRAVAGKVLFNYCPSIHGCRTVVHYLEKEGRQIFSINGNILRASFTLPRNAKIWVESLMLVSPTEFKENVLETSPLDVTRRYLRKCIGRPFEQIEKSNQDFCHVATFELTLGLNKYPEKCKCDPHGTVPNTYCDPTNGHCSCNAGFRGVNCADCIRGKFPNCKAKKTYNFDWL